MLSTYHDSLRSYAALTRQQLGLEEAPVISYLGLHLLLARFGQELNREEDRAKLTEALQADLGELSEAARSLLAQPHPAVAAAAGAWADGTVEHFSETLPPIPAQAKLDKWASEHTRGAIRRFPLAVDSLDVALLLATAVAVKTPWMKSFQTAANGRLFARHTQLSLLGVTYTKAAGLVAVVAPKTQEAVDVISVIGDTTATPAQTWAALEEVLAYGSLENIPTIDVEKDGHSWTVDKEWVEPFGPPSAGLRSVLLPAWQESVDHDLTSAPGVDAFKGNMDAVLCAQSAVGEYKATGFSAAAVTAVAVLRSAMVPTKVQAKHTRFDFARPHALTAVARGGAWDGLRLFDCWVTPDAPKKPAPLIALNI